MKLEEQVNVSADAEHMWSLLTNPALVVPCVPGASLTGVNDDGSLNGTIVTKLGPTRVEFRGRVVLTFDHASHTGTLEARGGDSRGRTKAASVVAFRLAPSQLPQKTDVHIDATIDVSGGLAPFVRTGGVPLARRMLQDFSSNLADLAARGDEQGSTARSADEPATRRSAEETVPAGREPEAIAGFRLIARVLVDSVWAGVRWLGGRIRRTGTKEGMS